MRLLKFCLPLFVWCACIAPALAQDEEVLPKRLRSFMNGLVGSWVYEGSEGQQPIRGQWTVTWAPGDHCLVYRERGVIRQKGDESLKFSGSGIASYDPSADEFVEVIHYSDGNNVTNRFSIPSGATGDLLVIGGQSKVKQDGTKTTGKIRWSFDGKDAQSYSVIGGDEPIKLELRRDKSEVARRDGIESTHAEFEQFGELLTGRWVGDITLVYDWPGEDKGNGDKVTSYESFTWIADKKGIEWEHFGGNSTGKTMIVRDAPSNHIRAFNVGSSGGTWQTVIWKETDTKWGWEFTGGGLADGRAFTGAGHWIFSDDGNALTITGDMCVGSEKVDTFADVYRRVDK